MPSTVPAAAYRLGPETRAQMEVIKRHFGLPSEVAAIRYAVARMAESIEMMASNRSKPYQPKRKTK